MRKTYVIKKVLYSVFALATLLPLLLLSACGSSEEALTEVEMNFAGTTWRLENIVYWEAKVHYVGGKIIPEETRYQYPSESSVYNALCERYCNNMTVSFGSTKQDGKLTATLTSADGETTLEWYGETFAWQIEFDSPLPSFPICKEYGSYTSTGYADSAMKNTSGRLCFNPATNMIYVFEKV